MKKSIKTAKMLPPPVEEEKIGDLVFNPNSEDICKTILDRYAKSSAAQHCHLCASACAMQAILIEEGIFPTPAAYFAAILTAIRDADHDDRDGVAALSAFLSILLPIVDVKAVPHLKAKDASLTVVGILGTERERLAATTVRSLVKCLGFLLLCLDLDDWDDVKMPLEVLFKFTLDQRPKVRRCSQKSVEKVFVAFTGSKSIKKAGNFLLSIFRHYISSDIPEGSSAKQSPKSDHLEALHLLNIMALVVPTLPKKINLKFLHDIFNFFGCQYSLFTRHLLKILEALLEHLDDDDLIPEVEKITSSLSAYLSYTGKNPVDTILSSSHLLRNVLNKLHSSKPNMWIESFPIIFTPLTALLDSKGNTAERSADILVDLINCHINEDIFPIDANAEMIDSPKSKTMVSLCTLLENTICACSAVPNELILKVISELFLRLGESSHLFTSNILLKLSELAAAASIDSQLSDHLQQCIGSAVISMGPEKILSLFPITLNEENLTCSNMWLVPILRKYTRGASLHFFMEHIAPVVTSLTSKCKKVKRTKALKKLRSYKKDLWNLLPSFCHHAKDTKKHFGLLAQFLIVALKDDPSSHESVSAALKVFVKENKSVLATNQDVKTAKNILNDEANDESPKLNVLQPCYSQKVALKNIKAMVLSSTDLIQAIVDVFLNSPPEKRSSLKEAIECLSSIVGSSNVDKIVMSLSKKLDFVYNFSEFEDSTCHNQLVDTTEPVDSKTNRCLLLELASYFVPGADEDLIGKIYHYVRHSLLAKDDICHSQAYLSLSRILKDNNCFCYENIDELMTLVTGVKSHTDINILRSRFTCLHFLLFHLMKCGKKELKEKAFLILNEIILTLKDSDKDVRKTAYDMLFAIACSFKESQSANSESPLHELLTMIIGYFSDSPPQIMSGAVAALSLLLYKDADLCLSVHDFLPSILALLKRKDPDVIKAVLGFIKVLVSSLHVNQLSKLLFDVANAILPWSSVSKNHFKSKVKMIFEIILRKCGADSVNMVVPEKYKCFIKTIEEQRQKNRAAGKGDGKSNPHSMQAEPTEKRMKKRKHSDGPLSNDKNIRPRKIWNERPFHDKAEKKIQGRRNHGGNLLSKSPSNGKYFNKRKRTEEQPELKMKKMKGEQKKYNNRSDEKPRGQSKKKTGQFSKMHSRTNKAK